MIMHGNDSLESVPAGWYKDNNGVTKWWTGSDWGEPPAFAGPPNPPVSGGKRPSVGVAYVLGVFLAPAGAIYASVLASRAKKLGLGTARYWVAFGIFSALTLVAVISILASLSTGVPSGTTALTAGSATADQMCQAFIGQGAQSTLTGQDLHETVASESDAVITSNLNASGNEVATCTFTLSTGATLPATVTLFANGSLGWHGA
jgi:hypothetical protein